ncbi:bZIP transcription factor 1 [Phytophthora citrophthora]|uniref:BZIP transcription factor 1 n=1 Tax=Phytophthora citrophthora TaxID=4793 RepID=A0AAD9GBI3_9STRA|nr:bZIP transcription factor 1 [Phytophthora citrophthora]
MYPPTTRVLQDHVIGVRQRSASPRSHVHQTVYADSEAPEFSLKRKRQEVNVSPRSKLLLLADMAKPSKPEPRFKCSDVQKAAMMEWVDAQKTHEREIRRLRQIRYRKKKDDYAAQLEGETEKLQKEIQKLEQRRRAVFSAFPSNKTLWNVAVEYFRLFRYGLPGSAHSEQFKFLRESMAPTVLFNAGRGVDSVMRNWKYFSLWFQDAQVELDGLAKRGVDYLIASITTSFTITQRSLTTVFPHLCTPQTRTLAAKLLGQRIVMQGLTRFDWDPSCGRVTSVISESDMLTPMLKLLGSLEDVSKVFEKSLISLTPYRGNIVMVRTR